MAGVKATLQQFVNKLHEQHTQCLEDELSKYKREELERFSVRTYPYGKPTGETVLITTDVYDEATTTVDQYKFSVITSWHMNDGLHVLSTVHYPTGVVRP